MNLICGVVCRRLLSTFPTKCEQTGVTLSGCGGLAERLAELFTPKRASCHSNVDRSEAENASRSNDTIPLVLSRLSFN